VIIGTKTHPEVLAIAAWCENPLVFESAEDFNKWLEEAPERREIPITMVSQTTSTQDLFHSCEELAKKECTNLEIFDTICNATFQRQEEAGELAKCCDAVVVIGDRKSSNTKRLAKYAAVFADGSMDREASELDLNLLRNADVVGITAGASTPEWIIKEVLFQMDEEIRGGEESFAELLEQSFKTLNTGEKVSGVVTAITPTEIHVDLGTKQPAIFLSQN
jgi:4-hydroxy-3-methylbut-2-enyl diphosphate reductase